ncbi:MAG: diguanylate cyclase domain-containing protein [Sulfuricaulis sp.]
MNSKADTAAFHCNLYATIRERLSNRADSEHGQAFIRFVIAGIGLVYVLILYARGILSADQHHVTYFMLFVFLAAIGILVSIIAWPQPSPLRRLLTMVLDFGLMSYFMYAMKGDGIPFFPVYLWVTIGYGLRYGVRYLYTAMVISVVSFSAVFGSSAYWREQSGFSIGLLIGLVALPLYFSSLLNRLKDKNNELKKLYEQMATHATHDSLTRLLNRKHFNDRLAETIESAKNGEKTFTVLYMDLDGFKAINDAQGHRVGDQLIENTARRLEQCVRKNDLVARVGGDEFTILLRDITSFDISKVAEKIIQVMTEPFAISGNNLCITTSIGVATYPQDGADANTLIHSADCAMYEAKRCGKNGYRICNSGFTQRAQ